MTKEQFLTFKSDMKKGMSIVRLQKRHSKAYYNDGFETPEDQAAAIDKEHMEVMELSKGIILKNDRGWSCIMGYYPHEHWTYYCAKHRLDENQIMEYLKTELDHMKWEKQSLLWYISPQRVYEKEVKPILDAYEKIVCADR